MNFKGQARRLDSIDIARIAATIGCGEDHLHAVMEVETRGGGFDRYGRPKMLFEPHVFYRELSGAARQEAVSAGLAYQRWGQERYPNDSYPRLQDAMRIDTDAALRSASWGLGQIMGFNCKLAGYSTAKEMVDAFLDDEATHLAAMVSFIVSNGLDDELRREDWRGFARGYNGAGYAKHGYHIKLKAAFDKWQKIPDTPFKVDRAAPNPNPPDDPVRVTRGRVLRRGMRGPDVGTLQGLLADLGYSVGAQDGIFGRLVRAAVMAFQSDNELFADGVVGELTWKALDSARPRPKRDVSEADLRSRGSRTIAAADSGQKAVAAVTTAGVAGVSLEALSGVGAVVGQAETALGKVQSMVLEYWPLLLVAGLGFAVWYYLREIKKARVDDAVSGRNLGR